jgi:Type II secretion system (T2SS), protein E, N-terminal domain
LSTPLRERPDAPLGTLIFRAGLLPAETIESALQESSRTGKRLGEILLERNLLEETQLSRLLAGQKGLPFVTLRERGVDAEAAKLFTEDQARLYRALPFQLDGGSPTVAISDPTNEVVMRNIREALDGTEVQFAVATRSELTELMSEVYNPNGNGAHANGNGARPAEPPLATADPEPVVEPEPAVTVEPPPEPEAVAEREPLPEPAPAAVATEPALVVTEPALVVTEPAPVVTEPAPEPEPAPQAALPEPEPVQAAAAPELELEPAPAAEVPAPMPVEPIPAEAAPEPPPAPLRLAPPPQPAPVPNEEPDVAAGPATVRVVIRLSNNDRIEAAVVGDPYAARAQAKALIRYIAGKDGSDWPYVGGRFLRPDAIVSVDLIEQAGEGAS